MFDSISSRFKLDRWSPEKDVAVSNTSKTDQEQVADNCESSMAIRDISVGVLTAATANNGDLYRTSSDRRQIGLTSAVFLIFNRMIGTGIFATPSGIFSLSGSVGLSLFIWVAGMLIAAAGMAVYIEFGTGVPRNGGEKNYLEYVYRRPKFLATGFYTGYVVLLGESSSKPLQGANADILTVKAGPGLIPLFLENISLTLQMWKLAGGTNVALVLPALLLLS